MTVGTFGLLIVLKSNSESIGEYFDGNSTFSTELEIAHALADYF